MKTFYFPQLYSVASPGQVWIRTACAQKESYPSFNSACVGGSDHSQSECSKSCLSEMQPSLGVYAYNSPTHTQGGCGNTGHRAQAECRELDPTTETSS